MQSWQLIVERSKRTTARHATVSMDERHRHSLPTRQESPTTANYFVARCSW
jgi:hypothetical protein